MSSNTTTIEITDRHVPAILTEVVLHAMHGIRDADGFTCPEWVRGYLREGTADSTEAELEGPRALAAWVPVAEALLDPETCALTLPEIPTRMAGRLGEVVGDLNEDSKNSTDPPGTDEIRELAVAMQHAEALRDSLGVPETAGAA